MIGLICVLVPSCLSPSQKTASTTVPSFQAALPQERIFPDTVINVENSLIVDPADQQIHLYGAGGETICFQLIMPPASIGQLTLQIDPLKLARSDLPAQQIKTQTIEPNQWRVFHLISVPIKNYDAVYARLEKPENLKPRRFPDPVIEIVPDKNQQFQVPNPSNENTILLLQVAVPLKTPAAVFTGQIQLKSSRQSFSRPLVLHTWGFDLPIPPVDIFGVLNVAKIWTEHDIGDLRNNDLLILSSDETRIEALAEVLGQYARLLDEGGVEPWLSKVYPKISMSGVQNMNVEWKSYRALANAVLRNSSRPRKFWSLPIDLSYPSSQNFGPYTTSLYHQIIIQYLSQFNDQFLKPGLVGKGVVNLSWPENYQESLDSYGSFLTLSHEIYRTEQPVIITNPFIPIDLRPMGWSDFKPFEGIKKFTQAICPEEKWLDPSMAPRLRGQGTLVWWRPTPSAGTLPAINLTYPGYFSQALPWTAWRYDSQGVVLAQVNDWSWPDKTNLTGSENMLVYPGKWFGQEKPVGSMRLKMIKLGLQDVSYLRALERAGKKNLADWLARHLVRFAHTDAYDGSLWSIRNDGLCGSDQAWALARMIAGLELSNQTGTTTTQRSESDSLRTRQKMFMAQFKSLTEGVAAEVDGVRAKTVLDIKTGNEKIEWTFHTVVRNFSDSIDAGTIRFLNISLPLVAVRDKLIVSGLNWAWPVRTELKLESPAVALGYFGVNSQPISLKLKESDEIILNARYCALAAQKLEKTIQVDGQLNDWPETPTSVAGNFLRIWPDGINEKRMGQATGAPVWPTTVQIGFTDQNLYFAFTCYQPKDSMVVKRSNTVASSAGLAWGEDLVEIMIDPKNTDSFNPLDVYHLIVKANGNCRGIRGTIDAQAVGGSSMWPNNARSAVKVFDDRWQVEIALPLSDFNGYDKFNRWWGIDFARNAAAVSELSTWSGTKNQYCKPISLGNVYLAK